jgi:gas vesicle protein
MERNYSGLFFAFLGGALVGASVAYLTAPASGAETRDRLRKLARAQRDRVGRVPEALVDAKEAFTEKISGAPGRHAHH